MQITLRLVDADSDELGALEDWLRSERALRRVVIRREHAPTRPGEMGLLADGLHFAIEAGLVGVLAQSLIDYWKSRINSRSAEDKPTIRIERVDAPDGTRTITIEARDAESVEAVLRELPRSLDGS
ncbi:effector-associated constant component EACC1 [Streptomyces sp. YKOK-J1]